jgi:hypothetical protein
MASATPGGAPGYDYDKEFGNNIAHLTARTSQRLRGYTVRSPKVKGRTPLACFCSLAAFQPFGEWEFCGSSHAQARPRPYHFGKPATGEAARPFHTSTLDQVNTFLGQPAEHLLNLLRCKLNRREQFVRLIKRHLPGCAAASLAGWTARATRLSGSIMHRIVPRTAEPRSPDGAQRNPGPLAVRIPDCASGPQRMANRLNAGSPPPRHQIA